MKIAFQKNKPWREHFLVANCYRWESVSDFILEESCMFSRYYIGIDACENINRFYALSVSPIKKSGKTFVCSFCGHRHTGDAPPSKCPDCGVGPEKFSLV